jgi:hypothetical protein
VHKPFSIGVIIAVSFRTYGPAAGAAAYLPANFKEWLDVGSGTGALREMILAVASPSVAKSFDCENKGFD